MKDVNELKELNKFIELSKTLGATDAKLIKSSDIIVRDWVRIKCQYGCGGYGNCLTCPPYSPKPEETRKILNNYTWAILLKFIPKPIDFDWKTIHEITAKLEREIFFQGYYSAFGFACGPCPYCETCNLKECVHPNKARPSMEASGIDVYATVRTAGYEIKVLRSEKEQPTYFSLVLIC